MSDDKRDYSLPVGWTFHGFEGVTVVAEDGTELMLFKIQFCECCTSILAPGHSVCPACVRNSELNGRHCLGDLVPELASLPALVRRFAERN